jgi:hypothetical protein
MTLSFILACLWMLTANVLAMMPSRDNHWRRAYWLIGIGIPILGFLTYENGPLYGIIALLAGMWMLRWPVIYLGRWVKRMFLRG